jgi:hypothetical protein
MVFLPGRGAAYGAVDVYRDGDAVVLVGRVGATRRALVGRGHVHVDADVVVRMPSVAAYDAEKERAFRRHPEKYALAVGTFKTLDDDAREAPELPEDLRERLERRAGDVRALAEGAKRDYEEEVRLLGQGQDDDGEDLVEAETVEPKVLP